MPDELVDAIHIIGDRGKVRERIAAWEESGVTTLLLTCRNVEEVRLVADVVLG